MNVRRSQDISFLLLHNKSNARLSITRNTGIAAAQAVEFCMFLDADNELYPRCIEKHAAALTTRPDAAAAHAQIEVFGADQAIIGCNVHHRSNLLERNCIDAMAMIRRAYLLENNGFRNIRYGWEDYDLWLRMVEQDDLMVHIPEILSRYRVHPHSMLRTETNESRNIRELHKIMFKLHPWLSTK